MIIKVLSSLQIVILSICICTLSFKYISLYDEVNILRTEKSTLENKLKIQNEEIEKYKISIEDYNSSVDTKIKDIQDKTKEYEKQILDKLKNDSSYKNQLNLVNRMMYEFSKNK